MSDFEIAVERLTRLANNPKTPPAVSGDLSLVLLSAKQSALLQAENERLRAENEELRRGGVAVGAIHKSPPIEYDPD